MVWPKLITLSGTPNNIHCSLFQLSGYNIKKRLHSFDEKSALTRCIFLETVAGITFHTVMFLFCYIYNVIQYPQSSLKYHIVKRKRFLGNGRKYVIWIFCRYFDQFLVFQNFMLPGFVTKALNDLKLNDHKKRKLNKTLSHIFIIRNNCCCFGNAM